LLPKCIGLAHFWFNFGMPARVTQRDYVLALQEALYNIARAYHQIGLNTLAAVYYEKALAIEEEDHPIPKLPYEAGSCTQEDPRPGYCDVRREAAFNLHLIYKKSGATDLARRILKTYCTF